MIYWELTTPCRRYIIIDSAEPELGAWA